MTDGGRVEYQQTSYATVLQDTEKPTAWLAAAEPWPIEP